MSRAGAVTFTLPDTPPVAAALILELNKSTRDDVTFKLVGVAAAKAGCAVANLKSDGGRLFRQRRDGSLRVLVYRQYRAMG